MDTLEKELRQKLFFHMFFTVMMFEKAFNKKNPDI